MDKYEMTDTIRAAKKSKGLTWEQLAEQVGLSPVFTCSACLGMNSTTKEDGERIAKVLGLGPEVAGALTEYPYKTFPESIPQDPLVYRLYEVVGVYGETMKEVIQEKFGDGIMSAIDFTMDIDKQEDPKGDRVVVTMNGKFLPYKRW